MYWAFQFKIAPTIPSALGEASFLPEGKVRQKGTTWHHPPMARPWQALTIYHSILLWAAHSTMLQTATYCQLLGSIHDYRTLAEILINLWNLVLAF